MSQQDLTQGRVSTSLARLTAPMMMGVSSSILVQTLEMGFIGQLGTAYVAAITFTFPLVMILTSIALGISIGTSSVIARSVGSKRGLYELIIDEFSRPPLLVHVSQYFTPFCLGNTFDTIRARRDPRRNHALALLMNDILVVIVLSRGRKIDNAVYHVDAAGVPTSPLLGHRIHDDTLELRLHSLR